MRTRPIKPAGRRRNREEYIKRNSKYKCFDSFGVTLLFLAECEKELRQITQAQEQVTIEQLINLKGKICNAVFLLQPEEGE